MGCPDLDTAMRSYARDHDPEDVVYRGDFAEVGGDDAVLVLLVLAVCDPNGHNEDHPMIVARATEVVRLVPSIVTGPERDYWHWVLFESRLALVHSQCM